MTDIEKLTELFTSFPGVGPRQAKRFVYYLLRKNKSYVNELAELIPRIKNSIQICSRCQRYFVSDRHTACSICRDENRNDNQLLIVAQDTDLDAIEKTGLYNGYYFVLGGLIPVLEKEPNKFIRLDKLEVLLVDADQQEIILAFSSNPDGLHTDTYLRTWLKEAHPSVTVTELGRGLSTGSELEYADKETIKHALENRK